MLKRIFSATLISAMLLSAFALPAAAADTIAAAPISTKDGGAAVVNPIKEYSTFAELQKAVDFTITLPPLLPTGYQPAAYSTISGTLAQVIYRNDKDAKILYRMERGNKDISGDYTVYKTTEELTYGDVIVTVKGSKTVAKLATWSKDDISYSLSLENGVKWSDMERIIDAMLEPQK